MELFDLRLWLQKGSDPLFIDSIQIDSRKVTTPNTLFVPLPGKKVDGHQFVEDCLAKWCLVKKGYQGKREGLIYVEDPLQAFQDIAALYRAQFQAQVVAITGSFGKTLVKDFLYHLVKERWRTQASPGSYNSQIGVPLSLLRMGKDDEVVLIETAVSQPFEMERHIKTVQPNQVILCNVHNRFLDAFKTKEMLIQENIKMLKAATGWVLLPTDPRIDITEVKSQVYFWDQEGKLPTAKKKNNFTPMRYGVDFDPLFEQELIPFEYFLDVINIGIKAATLLGVGKEKLKTQLKNYRLELMQKEAWRTPFGVQMINESYCSTPQSVDKALAHIHPQGRNFYLFGGLRHAFDGYDKVQQSLDDAPLDEVLLYDDVPLQCKKGRHFTSFSDAVVSLSKRLKKGDTVIVHGPKKRGFEEVNQAFYKSSPHNVCTIGLGAVDHNLRMIRSRLPPDTEIMAMVKAQGYGTDDVQLAKFLASCGIHHLGVSYVDEAIALKKAGVTQNIFVLNATPYEVEKVIEYGLEVGVSDALMVDLLQHEALKVHLHMDTGMKRFGCPPDQVLSLAKKIQHSKSLELEGFFTHLVSSEDPHEDPFTKRQLKVFEKAVEEMKREGIRPRKIHALNSSGALRFSLPCANMVRIGLALFGLSSSQATKQSLDLKLAISLLSKVVGINEGNEGDSISYGRSYVIRKNATKIAVLPIGYYDGLHRYYSGKGYVLIRGQKAPMVGRICMDYMMVDVTDIPGIEIGEPVLIFGKDSLGNFLAPEEFASKGNSIPHELVTCLGPRIQRVFLDE